MDLSEKQAMSGVLTLELFNANGTLVEWRRVHNLITSEGKQLLANLLVGKAEAPPATWNIVLGTGTNEPQPGDKALGQQVALAEVASRKVELVSAPPAADILRATVSAILPAPTAGTVQALTEAGIEITLGQNLRKVLFNRVRFAQVNRSANMVMNLSWEISF